MLPTINEFWKKAFLRDDNGKFIYPHYAKAAPDLDPRLLVGHGSRGGGYVLVCPNCGRGMYTNDKRRKFCSVKCKNEAYRKVYAMSFTEGVSTVKQVRLTRICQYCEKEFKASRSMIAKGGAVYCSKSCASKSRGLVPLTYICQHCGITFKSVWLKHAAFCSVNCMKLAPRLNNKQEYIQYQSKLLRKEDATDQQVNNEIYSIVEREKSKLPIGERSTFRIEAYTIELRERAFERLFSSVKAKQNYRKI